MLISWILLVLGCLIACSVTPGAIIAFSYLNEGQGLELKTILVCIIAIITGVLVSGHYVGNIKEKLLKRVMSIALSISVIALVIKMIIQAGNVGKNYNY